MKAWSACAIVALCGCSSPTGDFASSYSGLWTDVLAPSGGASFTLTNPGTTVQIFEAAGSDADVRIYVYTPAECAVEGLLDGGSAALLRDAFCTDRSTDGQTEYRLRVGAGDARVAGKHLQLTLSGTYADRVTPDTVLGSFSATFSGDSF